MKVFIHLIEDEKFLKAAINKFEINESISNIFLKVGSFRIKKKNFLFEVSMPKTIINWLIPFFHHFSNAVIIHGFFYSFLNLDLIKINNKVKIFGIFWGFDLYSLKGKKNNYLKEDIFDSGETNTQYLNKLNAEKNLQFINSRIDFVSTIVPNEFEILRFQFPKAKFKFMWFNYFDIENDVLNNIQEKEISIRGNNLLFGNNLSRWNNHLDGIEIIKSFKFDFGEIICPLSYAGTENYKKVIIEQFSINFGERFKPIESFLKYDEYLNLLSSSRFVFFNSKRQIGLGNLLFSLYLGSIVILDKENPLFSFFNSNEIKVFSIEEALTECKFEFDLKVTRKNLKRVWGESEVRTRTTEIFKVLTS